MGITNIVVIFIVLIIILFMIFKMLFKIASNLKVFGLAIIVSIFISAIGMTVLYINGIDYELLGTSNKYVSGQVVKLDDDEITVRIIEHNLDIQDSVNKNITIKLNNNTVVKKQVNSLFEADFILKDISRGHRVNITCYYNKNNIIAQKIVVKY